MKVQTLGDSLAFSMGAVAALTAIKAKPEIFGTAEYLSGREQWVELLRVKIEKYGRDYLILSLPAETDEGPTQFIETDPPPPPSGP